MRFLSYIFVPVLLAGCAAPHHADSKVPIPVSVSSSSLSIESFRFIGAGTTMQQVIAKLGQTDRRLAGGFCDFYGYRLGDGTGVTIGSGDHGEVLFVQHGRDTLFGDPLFVARCIPRIGGTTGFPH